LKKTDPDTIAVYGLIPIQQPADIYDGYGHGGRGGWSWYTGSAARMLSAAYTMLGIAQGRGRDFRVADDLSSRRENCGGVAAHRRTGVRREGRETRLKADRGNRL